MKKNTSQHSTRPGCTRRTFLPAAVALLALSLASCSALPGQKKEDDTDMTTLLLAAAMMPQQVTLNYTALVGSQTFSCGTAYTVNGTANVKFRDFRYFVSDIKMIMADNSEVPFSISTDNVWQTNGVALLDFENGSCGSTPSMGSGSTETNRSVRGTLPAGTAGYKGVKFTVGVPDSLNFMNVTDQPSPLNVNAMYWSWTTGYKHAKIEFSTDDFTTNITNLHLGSTTCSGGTCAKKYRPTVSVTKSSGSFSPTTDNVALDVTTFLTGYTGYTSANSCMPGTTSPCTIILTNMGLDANGASSGSQTTFSVR